MGLWTRISRTIDELSEEFLPDHLRDAVGGARELLELGRPRPAAAALESVVKQKPGHATALYLLGVARLRLGDAKAAAEAFSQASDARSAFGEALVGLGEARLELGDNAGALAALREALAVGGDRDTLADAYRVLGRAHLAAGDRDKGLRDLRKALAEDPDDAEAAATLGEALLAAADAEVAEARAPLERACRADPPPAHALVALGRLELAAGRETAEPLLRRALALPTISKPLRAEARGALAVLLAKNGDTATAHTELLQALADAPANPSLHARLGDLHVQVKSLDAALAAFEQALRLGADDAVAARALDTAIAARAWERAVPLAARLLAVDPTNPRALAARGAALAAADEPTAARRLLDSATLADEPLARVVLARLDLERDPAAAAAHAAAALRLDARDPAAREVLVAARQRALAPTPAGDLYALAGRVHQATLARPELAELAPDAVRVVESFDRPLVVTVMGEFSSGKSTFVNAFLGAEVAPVGITPTTATINVLKYGREPAGRIVYRDDRVRDLAWDEVGPTLHGLGDDGARAVRLVEILYPAEALQRVNIVDTPGLNSILPEHEATARQFIASADAIVWLFTIGQAGKATEREALTAIRAEGKRVLGVVNKIDQVSPDEVARIVEHIATELGGLVEALVPVSARRALAARKADDADALAASSWPALEAALEERFFRQARTLKLASCAARLGAVLERARGRVSARAEDAHTQAEVLAQATASARADTAVFLRTTVPEERRRVAERLAAAYRAAAREVLELVRPRKTRFGAHSATAPDRDYLIGFLDRGARGAIEPTRKRIAADLARTGEAARAAAQQGAEIVGSDAAAEIGRQVADAVSLVEARVFDRCRAYLAGYYRGGCIDDFFARVLPKLELNEDSVYHALVRHAPDLEAELAEPLAATGRAALEALAARLAQLEALADLARLEAEEGVGAALAGFAKERDALIAERREAS